MRENKNSKVVTSHTTPRKAHKIERTPVVRNTIEPVTPDEVELKFVQRVELLENGCWLWHGSMSTITKKRPREVAVFSSTIAYKTYKKFTAHRYAYEKRIGQLPDIKVAALQNTCGLIRCVNPQHYELVTRKGILLKAAIPTIAKRRRSATKCVKGLHDKDPDNPYYTSSGKRVSCQSCTQEIQRVMYARKKARKAKD